MSQRPLISVCIPCYNGSKFIGRTIESVLAQTFTDFELLLVDDKSSDDTVSIIRGFTDRRINFRQNDRNLGLALNWHEVLSQSVGKYVKLLCEDDILHPNCLAFQKEILEDPSNSSVVLAVCNRNVINSHGRVILSRRLPFVSGKVSGNTLVRKSVCWGSNLIGEPVVGLFRREAWAGIVMPDALNPYLADLWLWAQLLKKGDAFVDPRFLASFRISSGAVSSKVGLRQAAYFHSFAKSLRQDSFYRITRLDESMGFALSMQWCLLRNLFIRWHSRRFVQARSLCFERKLTTRVPANFQVDEYRNRADAVAPFKSQKIGGMTPMR